MENSGLGGRFCSGPNGGLLDLESPVQRPQQSQIGHPSFPHQYQMNLMGGLDNDHPPIGLMEVKSSTPKGYSPNFCKGKAVSSFDSTDNGNMSEDEEPYFTEDGNGENSIGGKGKKGSPWQRMKWTDNIVRLLIQVVAFVGDDGSFEGGVEGLKRKSCILQKKGKWKTVSKVMISKGCHVSPQQCEDKFNDLNKRYKRLNDILGRGTSCRVVENPALMDSMPHLTAKAKDDVRKILSSKHLFYKEMCAYHNGQSIPNCHDLNLKGYSLPLERCSKGINGSLEEEAEGNNDSDDDDDSGNEDDNNTDEDGDRMANYRDGKKENIEDTHLWPQSGGHNSFHIETASLFRDPSVSSDERKEWIERQTLQLLEQRVSIQAQALQLEKQRLKWLRYCSKKDREFERLRLENERMRLENEQSVLHLRQKQLEMGLGKNAESPLDPPPFGIEKLRGRDQSNFDRHH